VKKTVPTESFFNFFSPPKAPSDDDDVEATSDIEERLELDYQLGEDIKEKLIPRAVDWFTGEALQYEELDEELNEDDFEDEDDEEEDDMSEDRDDDDESEDEVCEPCFCKCYALLTSSTRMTIRSQSKKPPNASRVK
jgi:nucleosome assembly protein 1-like 1